MLWVRIALPLAPRPSPETIDAPFGALDQAALKLSTFALSSGDGGNDGLYNFIEGLIASWDSRRDAIAGPIKEELEGAEFRAIGSISPSRAAYRACE